MTALKLTIKERGIAWLEWNDPDRGTNVLSIDRIEELEKILTRLEQDQVKVLLIISEKPSVFLAGADINEIEKIQKKEEFLPILSRAHEVLNRLEQLPCKKIGLIHGACLGGGMELALSLDYRIATDAPATVLGLPEVQLGVIPGFGGCIRMPRLVGLQHGLNLILTARLCQGKQALKIGLIDELVPLSLLKQRGMELALSLAKGGSLPLKQVGFLKKLKRFLIENQLSRIFVFYIARKKLFQKTKGFYPAPLQALEVIKHTYNSTNLRDSLEKEKQAFCDVATGKISKHLIKIFFAMNKIKSQKSISKAPKSLSVGLLGAGVMGGGIAQLLADKNHIVRLKDVSGQALSLAYKEAHKIWNKKLSKKQINMYDLKRRSQNLSASLDFSGFHHLDLVIEALPEDINLKKSVIKEQSQYLKPSCILASNTSSLSITELAKAHPYPENVVGMHFFNPVSRMPLVEVVETELSSPEACAFVFDLAKRLGKTPIITKDRPGFVVNRILMPYLSEALWLLDQGGSISSIDRAFTHHFGFPMGPFRLMDEIGLDVCLKVMEIFHHSGLQIDVPKSSNSILTSLGKGKKEQSGFYTYEDGEIMETNNKLKSFQKYTNSFSDDEIVERGVYRLIIEGFKVLDEKVVSDEKQLDLALILGMGFPAFRGGLISYAREIGLDKIKTRLSELKQELGLRFQSFF